VTYPFATIANAPTRMKDPKQTLQMQISWTRANGQPAMLIGLTNQSAGPIQNA